MSTPSSSQASSELSTPGVAPAPATPETSGAPGTSGTSGARAVGGERAFAAYLARLARDERRPALAILRRGLDKRPGEAVEMFPYVVPWLSEGLSPDRQEDYFLVASLFALHQISWQISWPEPSGGSVADEQGVSNFGVSLRRLLIPGVLPAGGDRVERYIVALLDTPREGLPHQLRLMVSLLRAYTIPVDWAQLLIDLADWSCDDRRIQRAWAQAYWRYGMSMSTSLSTSPSTSLSTPADTV